MRSATREELTTGHLTRDPLRAMLGAAAPTAGGALDDAQQERRRDADAEQHRRHRIYEQSARAEGPRFKGAQYQTTAFLNEGVRQDQLVRSALASLAIAREDARNDMVLGDPAVRLCATDMT
jgi:hypothetical protein